MSIGVQMKAAVPKPLKQKAKAALALMDMTFNEWLETHLADWVADVEVQCGLSLDVAAPGEGRETPAHSRVPAAQAEEAPHATAS
jgi:hypothetical protein